MPVGQPRDRQLGRRLSVPWCWVPQTNREGYVDLKPKRKLMKPKPETHDEVNPISVCLRARTLKRDLPRPVRILDMADVIACDACGSSSARIRHFGLYCCKKCDEIVRSCILYGVVRNEPCHRKAQLKEGENDCDGKCYPCRLRSTLIEFIKIREKQLFDEEEELDKEEEFVIAKWKAKRSFLDWHLDTVELERYGGEDWRIPCRSMQHLNDAFEWSIKKLVNYINSMSFLRRELDNADRTALVRAYASRHFVYEIIRRSQQIRGFRILDVFELDSVWAYCRDDEKVRKKLLGCFFEAAMNVLVIAKNYRIDDEEYAYMRAISFFNPEAPGLKKKEFVSEMNAWFTKKFKESMAKKKAEKKRDKIGYAELEKFADTATELAELLLVSLWKTHTKKSDLMKELVKAARNRKEPEKK